MVACHCSEFCLNFRFLNFGSKILATVIPKNFKLASARQGTRAWMKIFLPHKIYWALRINF
jgi:hypothetical protein